MPIGDPFNFRPQSLRSFLDETLTVGFHHFEPYRQNIFKIFDDQLATYSRRFEVSVKDNVTELTLVLPGFKQPEVDVQLEREILTVRAKNARDEVEQSVTVGSDVDPDKIEATLEHGILTIKLHNFVSVKARKIPVK